MSKHQNFTDLIKKYFWFLLNEYGFSFIENKNTFINKKTNILISKTEWVSIRIELWLLTEPDFTKIDIHWLFENQIDRNITDKYLLEENIKYYSELLHKNAYILTDEAMFRRTLLLGLKKLFINIAIGRIPAEQLSITQYLNKLPTMDKKYYDYIKERDPNWDPTEELKKYFD
jgi:hypothetical protein